MPRNRVEKGEQWSQENQLKIIDISRKPSSCVVFPEALKVKAETTESKFFKQAAPNLISSSSLSDDESTPP